MDRKTTAVAAAMTAGALLVGQTAFAGTQATRPPRHAAVTVSCKKPVEEVIASDASDQTTSTVWANLTDGLVSFTSRTAGCVIVTVSGDVTAPDEFMFVRALLDGQTACTPSDNLNNALFAAGETVEEPRAMTYLCAGVAAGTHSVQIQYESYVGGPVSFYGHTLVVGHN